MKHPYIYLRGLRHVEHSVFNVAQNGLKTYYDPYNHKEVAYSSGQQVKRSILQQFCDNLNIGMAPITFNWEISTKASQKQPFHPCNPSYFDQLIGGYMKAADESIIIKRRSPLSISAMRPLHPSYCTLASEATDFDRKGMPAEYNAKEEKQGVNNVRVYRVKDKKQVELSEEELRQWLSQRDRSLPPHYYNPSEQKRATGLFVYDVAIDLRTLFCVSTNQFEPEVSPEMITKLETMGWKKGRNVFGDCLILPEAQRNEVIPALANALINWRITSNQARTFSLMETFAIAIDNDANKLADAIRTESVQDSISKVYAVVDKDDCENVYVTMASSGYLATGLETKTALKDAEAKLIEMLSAFDYEHQ